MEWTRSRATSQPKIRTLWGGGRYPDSFLDSTKNTRVGDQLIDRGCKGLAVKAGTQHPAVFDAGGQLLRDDRGEVAELRFSNRRQPGHKAGAQLC